MAKQRSTGGYNPYSYGINRAGQQDLFEPEFANIDFADFQGLNMNLINQNARFAQEVANKRLDELKEAQAKMLDEIKLNKRFDYVEKDLQNKLASVIQNAGNVQLSDAANYTNLNSNLISIKNDPKLKQAVYSSEQAKKAQEILDKDPNLKYRPWDAPMYEQYQKFLNGETNDFELSPVYKDVDLVSFWSDNFFKQLSPKEQTDLQKYGPYGLVQAKTEGRDVGELIDKIEAFKENTIKTNPEIQSHLERRTNYAIKGTPPDQLPAVAEKWKEDYLNESISAAASKFAQVNKTLSGVSADPNESIRLQRMAETRLQNAQTKQDELIAPYELKAGVLTKGKKIKDDVRKVLEENITSKVLGGTEKGPLYKTPEGLVKPVKPGSTKLVYKNGQYFLSGVYQGLRREVPFEKQLTNTDVFNAVNDLNTVNTSTTQQPSLNWDPSTQTYKQ